MKHIIVFILLFLGFANSQEVKPVALLQGIIFDEHKEVVLDIEIFTGVGCPYTASIRGNVDQAFFCLVEDVESGDLNFSFRSDATTETTISVSPATAEQIGKDGYQGWIQTVNDLIAHPARVIWIWRVDQ